MRRDVLWIRQLLDELRMIDLGKASRLAMDNRGSKDLVSERRFTDHDGSKHIEIKYLRVRDEIAAGKIELRYRGCLQPRWWLCRDRRRCCS